MRLKAFSIFTVLFFLFIGTGMGQIDTTWTKIYGGDRDDKAYDIISTADSGYLVIGSTSSFGFDNSQMYFLKLDSTGAIMWSKSHGGSNQEAGHAVIQTQDGGYLGVGYTNSWGSGGFDLLMVKLDANGNTIFEKYFGGTDWDFAWDVLETQPNVFVMAGETQSFGSGGKDAWIVRYDASNDIFDWNKTIGGSDIDDYKAITPNPTGGFYAAGRGVQTGHPDEDVMVTRFDANGDTIWNRYYGDTLQDYANDIEHLNNSKVAITGTTFFSSDTTQTLVLSIDSVGQKAFLDFWGLGFSKFEGQKVIEMDSNRIGISSTFDAFPGNTDMHFGYTYPSTGFYEKGSTYGLLDNESNSGLIYLNETGFIISGSSLSYGSNFSKIVTYLTDNRGQVITPNIFETIHDTLNIVSVTATEFERTLGIAKNKITNNSMIYNYDVRIFDTSGRVVLLNTLFPQQELDLNLQRQLNGIYIIQYINTSFPNDSGFIKFSLF